MIRWVFFLLLSAILSGCAPLIPEPWGLPSPAAVSQQQDFDRHLELFLATGDPASLDQYVADYPPGDHRARAQALSLFAHELKQCQSENASLVSASRSSLEMIDDLEEKNRHLRQTIEQLKSLLIQLEERAQ